MLKLITEYWELLVGVGTAIGTVVGWVQVRKKNKQQSTQMLYDEMEKLKKKLILQISNEVEHAATLGEAKKIIDELKTHCPECYKAVMKNRAE